MKSSRASVFLWVISTLVMLASLPTSSQAQQGYRPGDIVGTNFGFVNRYRWTNAQGQVIATNTVFRLSDFDGSIAFFVFFDVW
jgi:hypothetical protein